MNPRMVGGLTSSVVGGDWEAGLKRAQKYPLFCMNDFGTRMEMFLAWRVMMDWLGSVEAGRGGEGDLVVVGGGSLDLGGGMLWWWCPLR